MEQINDLRCKIDKIDKELTQLFTERMAACDKVGEYKKANSLKVFDPQREEIILQNKIDNVPSEFKSDVYDFFNNLMQISKKRQRDIIQKTKQESPNSQGSLNELSNNCGKVAYCGIEGSYTFQAVHKFFNKPGIENYTSFKQVMLSVESGDCDYGVLPIENTTSGSVLEVYDLLEKYDVHIVGEAVVEIDHCLLGLGEQEDLKQVISHPQALRQCSNYIDLMDYTQLHATNTAVGAKLCREKNNKSLGVIASKICAEIYGLKLFKENIANAGGNKTRFIVIGKKLLENVDYNKATVVFTLPHEKGSLINKLKEFGGTNMTKIESRPLGGFEYIFYLDFMSENIDQVLKGIDNIKVLGKYKGVM